MRRSTKNLLGFLLALVSAGACSSTTGQRDAGSACPSLDSYCATNHCVSDWSEARKPSTWCTADAGATYQRPVSIQADCSGFNVVVLSGTDTSMFYLYDPGTGVLVGVGANGFGPSRCLGGTLPTTPISFACLEGGVSESVCGH
jgi:hypothetical protein